MKNQRRKNNIIIGSLLAVLLVMGIGYAAFSSKLSINGTGSVSGNWDVKITNITSKEVVGTAGNKTEPTYTDTTATFYTTLQSPGDSMTYDIEVSNVGNVDAVLKKITVNTGSNDAITFETSGLKEGDSLLKQEKKLLTIKVTFNDSVTSEVENKTSKITVSLEYEQKNIGGSTGGSGTTASDAMVAKLNETVRTYSSGCVVSTDEGVYSTADPTCAPGGLYRDTVTTGRYIYRGSNPNNYITFNNETWRILSIESNGNLKIIKNDLTIDLSSSFDSTYSGTSSDYCTNTQVRGCGVWAATRNLIGSPSLFTSSYDGKVYSGLVNRDSFLNTWLNNSYYYSMDATSRGRVVNAIYNVGVPGLPSTVSEQETLENATLNEQKYKWKGKIALFTVSELLRASTDSRCTSLEGANHFQYCKSHNWLYEDGRDEWTLSPTVSYDGTGYVFEKCPYCSGSVITWGDATYDNFLRPVVQISNETTVSGAGTSTNPYQITGPEITPIEETTPETD